MAGCWPPARTPRSARSAERCRRVETEATPLQQETGRLVRSLAVLGAAAVRCVVVVYGLTRGDWLHGLLAGITLAMAMLPEEFPVVLTVFLALGAWRISQKQRADPPRAGRRDAGRGHGAVRGQDRHADPEPHDGAAAGRRRQV